MAHIAGAVVTSYRVLAGHVSGLKTLNNDVPAPRDRYLVLLGGGPHDYYAAFGYYGVYRIVGKHAYQVCAYNSPQVMRGGVTNVNDIVKLFRLALRRGLPPA